MIALLGLLAKLSVIFGFFGVIFASISDIVMKTDYMSRLDSMINLGSTKVKIVLILLSAVYLVIFFLAYINRLTKYSQNRKVKNKSGEIEVTIKTINEVAKDFLMSQDIIKNSKIKSFPQGKSVVIEAVVDTYNVDNLSNRLSKMQDEMSEFVFNATGINVKKSKVKLKKVLGETIVEKKIIENVESVPVTPPVHENTGEVSHEVLESPLIDSSQKEGENL